MSASKDTKLAFVPGTGRISSAIAKAFAAQGFPVLVGSRDEHRARLKAQELTVSLEHQGAASVNIHGLGNAEAAAQGNVVFWCVQGTLEERHALLCSLRDSLAGKLIVDVTNVAYLLPDEQWGQTSAALQNREALGAPARFVSAFKTNYWKLFEQPNLENPHAVFVNGDDQADVETVVALVDKLPGFKGVRAGDLKWSRAVELMGPPLLTILDRLNCGDQRRGGYRFAT